MAYSRWLHSDWYSYWCATTSEEDNKQKQYLTLLLNEDNEDYGGFYEDFTSGNWSLPQEVIPTLESKIIEEVKSIIETFIRDVDAYFPL